MPFIHSGYANGGVDGNDTWPGKNPEKVNSLPNLLYKLPVALTFENFHQVMQAGFDPNSVIGVWVCD